MFRMPNAVQASVDALQGGGSAWVWLQVGPGWFGNLSRACWFPSRPDWYRNPTELCKAVWFLMSEHAALALQAFTATFTSFAPDRPLPKPSEKVYSKQEKSRRGELHALSSYVEATEHLILFEVLEGGTAVRRA